MNNTKIRVKFKINKVKKKVISLILSVVMIFSITVLPVNAESYLVSEKEARELAQFFVYDNVVEVNNTHWTFETRVSVIKKLYDESNFISAYSCELTTREHSSGYVVISADKRLENLIMEYSDTAAPLYKEFSINENGKILYTGAMNYFYDTGKKIETLDHELIGRNNIVNEVNKLKKVENIAKNSRIISDTNVASEKFSSINKSIIMPMSGEGIMITDPVEYMKRYYGVTSVTCIEWKNDYESYCRFVREASLSVSYRGMCAPIAITNLIKMVAGKKGNLSTANSSADNMVSDVVGNGLSKGYYTDQAGAGTVGGTYVSTATQYLKESYSSYGISSSSSFTLDITYDHVRHYLDLGVPFMLSLQTNGSYYNKHAVAGYAYTRFRDNAGIKTFIKIADGYNSSGRFLDLAHVLGSSNRMHVARV